MEAVSLERADRALLLHLMDLRTAGPLETAPDAPRPLLGEAQQAYAEAAAGLGFRVLHHGPAEPSVLDRPEVPLPVREAAGARPDFLTCQPSLALGLGSEEPDHERTVMFNVHLDTVGGWWPPRFDSERFHGRGAVDAKGPAVALLAGLRAALARRPELGRTTRVLIQAVSGEEGGAMGLFGTLPLVEAGYVGRLNIFCEPTGGRLVSRSSASMTACLVVNGQDAIDDRPGDGHNATVLLGFLAQHLAATLPRRVPGARVCVAGLHTGTLHNKVYGSGRLLLNLAYDDAATAAALERATDEELNLGVREFTRLFDGCEPLARTAAEAGAVTELLWLKRGLPALDCRDGWAADFLTRKVGLEPAPVDAPAFTCDAIWMHGVPRAATAVYGPGDLAANNAHAEGEFVDLSALESYAAGVAAVVGRFSDHVPAGKGAP